MRFCLQLGAAAVFLTLPGSAQDATGAITLGGGDGGPLDVDGLQKSLTSGGVEGLNTMLKAMAAGMHGGDDSSAHVTKDASGNAMYDFRDISGGAKPATSTQAAPLPASKQAAKATPEAMPVVQQASLQATPSANARPDDQPSMPDFGIVEPAKTQKPRLASHSLVSSKTAASSAIAPSDQDDDEDDESTSSPAKQDGDLIVWPPEPPTASVSKAKVVKAAASLATPSAAVQQAQSSTSTDEETAAALANGLGSMRQKLDTLLSEARGMVHTHAQTITPAPTVAPASASTGSAGGAAGAEILERLQAIEDENAKTKKEEMAQALRLKVVEDNEQQEGAELKKLTRENKELRDEIKASQGAVFMQDKRASGSGIRTFFHKKEKTRQH